jgi:hypothetical protein
MRTRLMLFAVVAILLASTVALTAPAQAWGSSTCGSCSMLACRGVADGGACSWFGGGTYHFGVCQSYNFCSDQNLACICSNRPPS